MIKNQGIMVNNIYQQIFNFIKNLFFIIIVSLFIFFIFKNPKIISKGVSKGLNLCVDIIIPSLFPFMVICSFIAVSPIMIVLSKIFKPVTKYIFNLPSDVGCLIFISFIGGYPIGAKAISELLYKKEITEKIANRLLCFCVNAGPAFVITAIGYMMYGSKKIGCYLLISHILGSIVIGSVLGLFNKDIDKKERSEIYITSLKYSQAFVKAVVDSSFGIISISSFVVIFSVITVLIKNIFANNEFVNILLSFLEITVGMKDIMNLNGILSILLCSFLISFSGFSVICQILYFIKDYNLNKTRFLIFRIIHGFISAGIIYLILFFSKDTRYTSVVLYDKEIEFFDISPFLSSVILLISFCFIIFSYSEFFEENKFLK